MWVCNLHPTYQELYGRVLTLSNTSIHKSYLDELATIRQLSLSIYGNLVQCTIWQLNFYQPHALAGDTQFLG